MTNTIQNVANGMGDAIKAFRSAAVSAENKATPMARSIFASLLCGAATPDKVIAVTIASFGNPKSPKTGKPVTNLSGLRDFVGGDGTRKMVESILKTFENAKGSDTLKALVTSFVLNADGAPKSLRAVEAAVKDAMRADAAADLGTDETTAEPHTETPTVSLADVLNTLAVQIAAMSDDELLAVSDNLNAVRGAIVERFDAYATAQLAAKIAA